MIGLAATFIAVVRFRHMQADDRAAVEARWLGLTRVKLPAVAAARGWPVRADHCFQRILLDNACGGVWYDHILCRPAYAHADRDVLDRAVALAEQALAGEIALAELNRRSLAWRSRRASDREDRRIATAGTG